MKSIQQRATLLLCVCQASLAFHTPQNHPSKKSLQSLQLVADPADLVSAASSSPEIPALISTMLSTALQPAATGHSNPLFGPPDAYLAASHSIAPPAKAMISMGVTQAKTASDMVPDAPAAVQQSVDHALNHGWKVLDYSSFQNTGAQAFPGFKEITGIFGTRQVAPESPQAFAVRGGWANSYFKVMDKLPFVAFWYVMVEFFILRRRVDMYKEEIEDDPTGALADTIAVGSVRLMAIAFLSILTVVFTS